MAKYDVFISYSRKDTTIADKICDAFDDANISYFIDRQGIGGGMEFPIILADAICDSELFLFLASKNSYESKFTNNEITFAFNEKPKQSILPYIIDGSELPRHMRFVFAGINWRNIDEHPIPTILVSDIIKLLGREINSHIDVERHKVKIITQKQADLIGNLTTQLNPISNIINRVLYAKRHYSSIIQIKSYKHIPNIGVAIVGKVLYGQITANSHYLIKRPNLCDVGVRASITHDIKNNPAYSDIVIRTMKKYSSFKSEYDVYLSIFTSTTNSYNSIPNINYTSDIVGLILTGVSIKHIENCKFLYKID